MTTVEARPTTDEIKKRQIRLRACYQRLFNSPDAKDVMEDLYLQFNGTTLKHYRQQTEKHTDRIIDPNASIAAAGCREVLLYIELMMRDKNAITK